MHIAATPGFNFGRKEISNLPAQPFATIDSIRWSKRTSKDWLCEIPPSRIQWWTRKCFRQLLSLTNTIFPIMTIFWKKRRLQQPFTSLDASDSVKLYRLRKACSIEKIPQIKRGGRQWSFLKSLRCVGSSRRLNKEEPLAGGGGACIAAISTKKGRRKFDGLWCDKQRKIESNFKFESTVEV